jgi:hypothetical protein
MRTVTITFCTMLICLLVIGCETPGSKSEGTEENEVAAKPKPVFETKIDITLKKEKKEAAKALTGRTGPYTIDTRWMGNDGFVVNWLIIGPFPNPGERPDNQGYDTDYLKDFGGEIGHIPAAGMEIARPDGTIVKWQPYKSSGPTIDFFMVGHLALDYSQEDVLTYSACWLECEEDVDVEIRVGSDDGYKLWLDHKLLGAEHVYRACEIDQESYPVKLTKGMHLLLIKVDQDWGDYLFMLRVVSPDGKAAPGVRVWN